MHFKKEMIMKIETKQLKKLTITKAHRLDQVDVILEDIEQNKGKIVITCYGKAWTAYWGGMSDKTVAEFFLSAGTEYIAGCIAPHVNQETQWNPMENDCDYEDFEPEPNHEYKYICRIIDAVKEALVIEAASMAA